MFWRRRKEKFEWHEYVRTTVLVRRQQRRQRLEDAKVAAVDGLKDAGRRGVELGASGASAAGSGLRAGAVWLAALPPRLYAWVRPRLTRARIWTGNTVLPRIAPALVVLARPSVRLPLALIAAASLLATVARISADGFDHEARFPGIIALVAVVLLLAPALLLGDGWPRLRPRLNRFFERAREPLSRGLDHIPARLRPSFPSAALGSALTVLFIGALAGGGLWLVGKSSQPATSSKREAAAARPANMLEGRATALAGDRLRVSGSVVKLADVEAPEPDQRCAIPSVQQWRCGEAARNALARMVRGQRVSCEVSGPRDPNGTPARCTVNGVDIAAELVNGGHVFAMPGFFAHYSSEESAARDAKVGLWAGEADRPSEYRARRWEEAKRSAPEGCPIKGRIESGRRVYLLPWSESYDRVRVSSARGERWFCSEAEAQAAGWKPTAARS